MANDNLLNATQIPDILFNSTQISDNATQVSGVWFNATQMSENVTEITDSWFDATEISDNVSQIADSWFNSTEIYDSLFNVTHMYDNMLNDTETYGVFGSTQIPKSSPSDTVICSKNSTTYPTGWDVTVTTEVVLNCVVCILGILGNAYAILMVFGNKQQSWVHRWRKTMVICDLLLLGCDLNQITVSRIARSFLATQNYSISRYTYVWVLLYPIRKMIETISIWITVSVLIERCIFICNPPKAVSMCKNRLSGILFLFVTIFAVSINFPRFREYKARECYIDVQLNITSHEIWAPEVTVVIANYRRVLDWIYVCVIYIVPFAVIIVSNSLLCRAIHKYNTDKENSDKEMEPEINFMRMIVCFSVVFCVCKFPKMVEEIYANKDISVESMTPFSNLMLSINSAINFVIYTLF